MASEQYGLEHARTKVSPLRVGLVIPANNTTMERELLGWLPPGSTCQTLRIPRGKGLLTREAVPAYQAASLKVAAEFTAMLDVIAYGCTAAGFIAGPQADATLAERLTAMHRVPVVTTASAMVAELQADGVKRAGLVTPYSDEVNAGLAAFLAASGIAATRVERLHAPDVEALGRLTADDVEQAAQRLAGAEIDAAFIACSQLPTVSILARLRQVLGMPVLSSIQATAVRILGVLAAGTPAALAGAS